MQQSTKETLEKQITEKSLIYLAFSGEPKTMRMVEAETSIRRTNFTALVNTWVKEGKIYLVEYGRCKDSNINGVGYYSTNEQYKPVSNQLNLFL